VRARLPTLVVALLLVLSARVSVQSRSFDLLTASVDDVQAAVAAGALTYERLVTLYLARIDAYDKKGPRLNAIIEINPRALETARALDAERRRSGLRSPLHGIPIAVKDNLDVSDMPSAGGNLALGGTFPPRDATVIRRLRDAGAIIFLKTNMDELALGNQGLSSLGGQILNPYDLTRDPGGSSGGTGVSVNVGFATVGIGTETGVSIRSPAANNALVGIAPTQGLVSRAGVLPISFTQDRVGPHAKSVADAALLLTYLRGIDPDDLLTAESAGKVDARPYTDHLFTGGAFDLRIGVLRELFRQGEEFREGSALVDGQIQVMRDRGARVIDGLTTGANLVDRFPNLRVNDFELRVTLDAYLARRGPASPVKSLAELVASGKYLRSLEPRLRQALTVGPLDGNAEYVSRLKARATIRQSLVDLMDRASVDALVYPFKSLGAPLIGDGDRGPRDNPLSSVTGLPAIVLPAGLTKEGLPIAIEILGRPFSEPALIRIASAYEQATHARVAPATTPHLAGETFDY
jgi:amidase